MLLLSVVLCLGTVSAKPRLIVLTDIGGDPDDQQSLIRLMLYAHAFDIEGLIASASGTPGELGQSVTQPHLIREIVTAYGKVRGNLCRHHPDYPAAAALRACVKSGNPHRGLDAIGAGRDTEASRWIVSVVDRPDPRPVNIAIWGGQTDLVQALWWVREHRSPQALQRFLARLRIYDIADQDGIYSWVREQFPDLFYILNRSRAERDKRTAAFRGMYLGGEESFTSRAWIEKHVRGHGPLGALYPDRTWTAPNPHGAVKEGDTPSWFYFLPNGLNCPEHPEFGGWGGRFRRAVGQWYRDAEDTVRDSPAPAWRWKHDEPDCNARWTVARWRPDFQNDFQARLDWCVKSFEQANHAALVRVHGISDHALREGDRVELRIEAHDPDGDEVRCRWVRYREPDTAEAEIHIDPVQGMRAGLEVRSVTRAGIVHLIVQARDQGNPPLCAYRRIVLELK
jgi:hypothetical protein